MDDQERKILKNILSRHGVLNSRFKGFNVLWAPFCRHRSKDRLSFFAVANFTLLLMKSVHILFNASQ